MSQEIRKFGIFCIFFSSTLLVFWPYALVLIGTALSIPLLLIWQGDFLTNTFMLLEGLMAPSNDVSLIFLMPAMYIFGAPILICSDAGSLSVCHKSLLTSLTEQATSLYGLLGLVLTLLLAVGLIFWTLWCVRKIMDFTWRQSAVYFSLFIGLIGVITLFYKVT